MTPKVLSDDQKIDVFRQMVDAWENKQWRRCADLLAPDGRLHSMMHEPLVGREVLYERLLQLARPGKQVKLRVHRIGVIGDAVIAERTDEITIDGITRSVPVVGIMEFEGGLISVWREYYDRAQLLRAQGRAAESHED